MCNAAQTGKYLFLRMMNSLTHKKHAGVGVGSDSLPRAIPTRADACRQLHGTTSPADQSLELPQQMTQLWTKHSRRLPMPVNPQGSTGALMNHVQSLQTRLDRT